VNHLFFAPCPRGLESALTEELKQLGLRVTWQAPGGVGFEGELGHAYLANLESRIASRVLWRIAKARYRTAEDLYQMALALPWWQWFSEANTLRVDVTASKSPLKSVDFATLRIKDAVCDAFRTKSGSRPSIDTHAPDVRIFAFLDAEQCTLYLDTSGEALFKRGWRHDKVEAPLRENLAAGILWLSGWRPGTALIDPMCGSGTFIVEAAQMTLGIAAGGARTFGFERLKNFEPATWNLVSAGITREAALRIAAKQIDARFVKPNAKEGILVANPPYGERIAVRGAEDDAVFFTEFGNNLKARFAGWQCLVLTSDMALQRKIHLAPKRRTPLFNGAIECRLYQFSMVAGSTRKDRGANEPVLP
jgi:putative N6-adenine-specific DNA methylase